ASRLTASAKSLHKRQSARRTEMMCTAMNSLFRTRTLASRAALGLVFMEPFLSQAPLRPRSATSAAGCDTPSAGGPGRAGEQDRPRNSPPKPRRETQGGVHLYVVI